MNAIRLNLEYHKATRGVQRGYLQVSPFLPPFDEKSLLSVMLLPCMSGLVGAVLLQQTPGFIISDQFLPTHLYVTLLLTLTAVLCIYYYTSHQS